MTQLSDSLHVYLPPHPGGDIWTRLKEQGYWELRADPYADGEVTTMRLGAEDPAWDEDLKLFFKQADQVLANGAPWRLVSAVGYSTPFFQTVVAALWDAWHTREPRDAVYCAAPDWSLAAHQWLERRAAAKAKAVQP